MKKYLLDNGPLVGLLKGRPGAERFHIDAGWHMQHIAVRDTLWPHLGHERGDVSYAQETS